MFPRATTFHCGQRRRNQGVQPVSGVILRTYTQGGRGRDCDKPGGQCSQRIPNPWGPPSTGYRRPGLGDIERRHSFRVQPGSTRVGIGTPGEVTQNGGKNPVKDGGADKMRGWRINKANSTLPCTWGRTLGREGGLIWEPDDTRGPSRHTKWAGRGVSKTPRGCRAGGQHARVGQTC